MENDDRSRRLEAEIERRLSERFAGLRDEFDRLRVESDRRWVGFLERFDQNFSGIVPAELLGASPEATAPLPPGGTISIEDARTLDDASSQVEALGRFLDLCRKRSSRVALLVSRAGTLSVWKAVGFSEHGGNDDAVRRIQIPPAEGNPFSNVFQGIPERMPAGSEASRRLDADGASQAILVPMVVREKVSGALYADAVSGEEDRFDPDSIALLTFLAGLIVDRLAARKLKPAPALRPISVAAAARPEASEDREIPIPREIPLTPPPPYRAPAEERPEPAPDRAEAESSVEKEAPEPERLELEGTMPPGASRARPVPDGAGETMRIPQQELEAAQARAPFTPFPPAPARPAPAPPAPGPPPPPSAEGRRLTGPLAAPEADERREEARRFAKLLVSEIKLYNERVVMEGRERGNLYERLKDDIDRSRQMYEERIPEDIRSSSNYFYDELVRTLADGRPESLGI